MNFTKTIGGREFELALDYTPRFADKIDIEYHLHLRSKGETLILFGAFVGSETWLWSRAAADAIRLIVKSQNCELPRLQGYEIYLLNLWKRELEQ